VFYITCLLDFDCGSAASCNWRLAIQKNGDPAPAKAITSTVSDRLIFWRTAQSRIEQEGSKSVLPESPDRLTIETSFQSLLSVFPGWLAVKWYCSESSTGDERALSITNYKVVEVARCLALYDATSLAAGGKTREQVSPLQRRARRLRWSLHPPRYILLVASIREAR